jgi:hypothetical protein
MQLLDYVETHFVCAGFCDISEFYTFSDVGLGPPTIGCVDAVTNSLSSSLLLYGGVTLGVASLFLFGIISTCITCCCYDKTEDLHVEENEHRSMSGTSNNNINQTMDSSYSQPLYVREGL